MLERITGGAGARGRRRRWAMAVLLLTGLVAALVPVVAVAKKNGGWTRRRTLAPGVVFTKIKNPKGPWRIFILSVEPDEAATLDTVLAGDRLPGFERTSSMAGRSGAIAAVNGDYASGTGRPIHTFARDGFLDQKELSWGRNFSLDAPKTTAYVGHPTVTAWTQDPVTGLISSIERVNQGLPTFDEIAMYTPSGGSLERPPKFACSARLYPTERPRLRTGDSGVDSLHTVDKIKCAESRLTKKGGVVIATPSVGYRTTEISNLAVGQQLTLSWSLGWPGVLDTIGGNPVIVRNGTINEADVTGTTKFHGPNPRTGVGVTAAGQVLLITVDGRRPGYSKGMSLRRFAKLFLEYGATWALNLDGGGSTTVVVDGQIKNRPSDGRERLVSSALVVLPGPDPGEEPPPPPDDASSGATAAGAWHDIATDPGSTGGLAAYLRAETGRVPTSLRAAEKAFRAD
jgi:hypothetical protein